MISEISIFNIKAGEIVKENNKKEVEDNFRMEISGDIDLSNAGYKVLIVYVDIYYYNNSQLYTMAQETRFSCQMTETDIVKFKEDDYIGMTNAIQSAISMTQITFIQKSSQLNMQISPLQTPLYKDAYNNLKDGIYSMWN